MQLCINRHIQQEQTLGGTFNETGVVSQASVGEYCTSDYKKKNDQHDDFKDVFTLCFKYL